MQCSKLLKVNVAQFVILFCTKLSLLANPLSIVRSTRLERLASIRHQHTGIVNTATLKDEDNYDIPTELLAQYQNHNTQDVENTHFYHVLESPSPPLPASPPRPDLESPSDSQGKYLTMYPPGSTPASARREILPTHPEEEEADFIGYHAPTELETHMVCVKGDIIPICGTQ